MIGWDSNLGGSEDIMVSISLNVYSLRDIRHAMAKGAGGIIWAMKIAY